jgi:hypothetical protein
MNSWLLREEGVLSSNFASAAHFEAADSLDILAERFRDACGLR